MKFISLTELKQSAFESKRKYAYMPPFMSNNLASCNFFNDIFSAGQIVPNRSTKSSIDPFFQISPTASPPRSASAPQQQESRFIPWPF